MDAKRGGSGRSQLAAGTSKRGTRRVPRHRADRPAAEQAVIDSIFQGCRSRSLSQKSVGLAGTFVFVFRNVRFRRCANKGASGGDPSETQPRPLAGGSFRW